MAIVETMDPDAASASYSVGDFYPLTRWQTAGLILDVGLMMTPLAIFSGIRKAKYIRGGIRTVRAAQAGRRVAAVESYMVSKPVRTFLFAGGTSGMYIMSPISPIYPHIMMARDASDVFVAWYIDREGNISSFLPTDQFIADFHMSSGEDSNLAIRTGTPTSSSFYDGYGLAALRSVSGSTPPLPTYSVASSKKSGRDPLAGRVTKPTRGGFGARGRTSPWWFSTKAKRRISRSTST